MSEMWEAKISRTATAVVSGELVICECYTDDERDPGEIARQIAREHNTHAALVEALELSRKWLAEQMADGAKLRGYVFSESYSDELKIIDAALAAAKGATSEHR